MTITNKNLAYFLVLLVVVAVVTYSIFNSAMVVRGSAPAGLVATIATTSSLGVGPLEEKIYWPNTSASTTGQYSCAARIISTTAQPITLYFANSSSTALAGLNSLVGHVQGASTTVEYDGGIYGCGFVAIHGTGGSTTITISETR